MSPFAFQNQVDYSKVKLPPLFFDCHFHINYTTFRFKAQPPSFGPLSNFGAILNVRISIHNFNNALHNFGVVAHNYAITQNSYAFPPNLHCSSKHRRCSPEFCCCFSEFDQSSSKLWNFAKPLCHHHHL